MRRMVAVAGGVLLALVIGMLWWRAAPRPHADTRAAAIADDTAVARTRARWPLVLSESNTAAEDAAPGGELEGRILSTTTGQGVPGAHLTFWHGGAALTVSGDATGRFRFRAPEPGRYDLRGAVARGYLPFAAELGQIALIARPGVRVRDVTLFLTPAVEFTGVVVDSRGAPVAGAAVRRVETMEGEPTTFTTDSKGEFTFHATDGAAFEARGPRTGRARAHVDDEVQRTHRLVLRLDDAPTGGALATLGGIVLDERGAPIDGAVVFARTRLPGGPHAEWRTESGADGRFLLDRVDAGDYTVGASARGLQSATVEHIRAGTTDLTLTLRAAGGLRGRVTDAATGRPIAAFSIVAVERRGPLQRGADHSLSIFDADGRYELAGLAPGTYWVTALAHGHAPAKEQLVDVPTAPDQRVEANFALSRGGRVRGVVRDRATREPLAGARVSLEGAVEVEGESITSRSGVSTDASGAFELRGVAPGLHSIFVAADGHDGRILSGLRLDDDGEVGPLDVDLSATAPGETAHLELVGIGAVLSARDDGLVIVSVMPESGAEHAGLASGDIVLSIDGANATEVGFAGAIERIRGPEGSIVTLGIRRRDGGALATVAVTRSRVVSRPG